MKKKRLSTMVELVQELERLPRTPAVQELIDEARAGEYHDYKNNKYDCGKVESSRKLRAAGLIDLAKRIENGDFDEEPDADDDKMIGELIGKLVKPPPVVKPKIIPRIRGNAVSIGARWGWEIMVTFEADKTIANLPAVNATLVQTPESLNLKSDKEFPDKQSALRDLEDHANNVFRTMMIEFGTPDAKMMDAITMEEGNRFHNGRIVT